MFCEEPPFGVHPKESGELAFDADWEGYNHWVDRTSGQVVADPPYPVPAGWLERFAWRISRAEDGGRPAAEVASAILAAAAKTAPIRRSG